MYQQKEVMRWVVFRECRTDARLETGSASRLQLSRQALRNIVKTAGYTVFGSNAHRYSKDPSDGYTVTIIIGQSAMIFHTYPEKNLVTLCSVTCPEEEKGDAKVHAKLITGLTRFFNAGAIQHALTGELVL